MKLRPFELGLVVFFVVLGALALIWLKIGPGKSNDTEGPVIGSVSIWGMLPQEPMSTLLSDISIANDAYEKVTYRYIAPDTFEEVLVNALADEKGPDVVLISHEQLVNMRKRIKAVSFDSVPLRDVRTTYLDGAQIFALSDGLYGYPMFVDPLMLYWNRDILATESLLEAPSTWEALVNTHFEKLNRRTSDRTIERSAVALGEYSNIRNSFAIISALLLQSGSQGVTDDGNERYGVKLNQAVSGGAPFTTAIDFYTRFGKTNNSLYSWNRSFEEDRASFISEDVAMYFGYASEGSEIERLNPNLNFDIAEFPQGAAATVRRTYGKFYALSALKSSDNLAGASAVMSGLSSRDNVLKLAQAYNIVPAQRALVGAGSNDTYGQVAYKSAAVSYGWLNPQRQATDTILQTLLLDVIENRTGQNEAVSDAIGRLELEYN